MESSLWDNILNLEAFKAVIMNFKAMGFKNWLLYELCPSFYITGPNWPGFWTEFVGWLKHIGWGIGGTILYLLSVRPLSLSTLPMWILAIGIPIIIEIIQFLKIKGTYIFPINSIIDISFYVIGVAIVYHSLLFIKGLI